jgi:hypothetical protein
MRTLLRNKTPIYYALYTDRTPIIDAQGYETGDYSEGYTEPAELWASVSANKGEASVEPFGADLDYTKTIITDDMTCPISETSRLWIGREPDDPYNYAVVRVAKSLNHITYAVKEVDVS